MLHIFHTVVSFTWHFLRCVCACVSVYAQVKEDDYKLARLSPSIQWLMMERLKSSPCKSDLQSCAGCSLTTLVAKTALRF